MWRYLVGAVAALLLVGGGMVWFRGNAARAPAAFLAAPATAGAQDAEPLAEPPAASEKTREEKRFSRYDKDKNGMVARDEYLAARKKAFAKLDTNGDGTLSFEEYAVKTTAKFTAADADKSGALNAAEFATTRVVRKARPRPGCPPAARPQEDDS